MIAPATDDLMEERDRRIWNLRLQGLTQQQIADRIEISQASVSLVLKKVSKALAAQFVEEQAELKATQTAQLEHLYLETYGQWQRSKENAEKTTTKTIEVEGIPQTTTTDESKGQTGNPQYLDQMRGILSDIRDIWGLDAPKKTDITSNGNELGVIGYEVIAPRTGND